MNIQIIADNLEITTRIQNIIQQHFNAKLEPLINQYDQDIKEATITLEKHTRWGYKANFRMWLPQKYEIYADTHNETLTSVFTNLRKKIEKQIKKYKQEIRPQN